MWALRGILRGMFVVGVTVNFTAACAYHTPGPPGTVTNPVSPAQRDSVLACARRLRYDSMTHGAADRQRLTYFDSTTGYHVGPLATIFPEQGAIRNGHADLSGKGRIIGRIESDSAYAKLGLSKGVNYIWVDSLRMYGDTGLGRAIVISEAGERPVILPMFYIGNKRYGGSAGRALARWLFRPQDDAGWLTCEESGCCAVGISSSAGMNLGTGLF